VGAAKLTAKVSGTSVAFLSAVDQATDSSLTGDRPVLSLLRVQRDVGVSSKLGFTYTDRMNGDAWNRMADLDGAYLFGGVYSFQGLYAQSFTRQTDGKRLDAPLWHAGVNRNGRHLAFGYALDGVHEDFRAANGFIQRGGVVNGNVDQRYTWFGARGALYASYRVLGTNGDTLPFTGRPRIPNSEAFISINTPTGQRLSFTAFYLWGHDENFFEWASSNIIIAQYGLNYRPTDKLRVNATYNLQSFNRRSDGSIVGNNRIPRLKVEYQIARPVFVRLIGEYQSSYRDALRDESGSGRPIITYDQCAGYAYQVTVACQRSSFRGDFLFSYQPSPGTVLFVGYGAGYADRRALAEPFDFPASFGFRGYDRTDDALFVKASYLFRL
jgi:hypothetical protein